MDTVVISVSGIGSSYKPLSCVSFGKNAYVLPLGPYLSGEKQGYCTYAGSVVTNAAKLFHKARPPITCHVLLAWDIFSLSFWPFILEGVSHRGYS